MRGRTSRALCWIIILCCLAFLLLETFAPIPVGAYYLHHRYGFYKKIVVYREGMTLYPRQSAVGYFRVPITTTHKERNHET